MSEIFQFKEHLMIISKNKKLEEHKHLAFHIIVSLKGEIEWKIGDKLIRCRGICIDSDVIHSSNTPNLEVIVLLFQPLSSYKLSIDEQYLKGKAYGILSDDIVEQVLKQYKDYKTEKQLLDSKILTVCSIKNSKEYIRDSRVQDVVDYIRNIETIDHSTVDELSKLVYLSKSRLSHIFKEETGITIHSYLAFEKLHKTNQYYLQGKNLTEAAILAGFNSSSHCSATCKRIFGISISDAYK